MGMRYLLAVVVGVISACAVNHQRELPVEKPTPVFSRWPDDVRCRTGAESTLVVTPTPLSALKEGGTDFRRQLEEQRAYLVRMGQHPKPLVMAHLRLPDGVDPTAVLAQGDVGRAGWFATTLDSALRPFWFALPGYEPISVQLSATEPGEWYAGELQFRRLQEAATLIVNVTAPRGTPSISLHPWPCPNNHPSHGVYWPIRPAIARHEGTQAVFEGLPLTPWRIVVSSPGSTSAELSVTLGSAVRHEVNVALEIAKEVTATYSIGQAGALCDARTAQVTLVPGEELSSELGERLRLRQTDGVVRFDTAARSDHGGWLGTGALSDFCAGDLRPLEPIAGHEVRTGDTFVRWTNGSNEAILMRFTVR